MHGHQHKLIMVDHNLPVFNATNRANIMQLHAAFSATQRAAIEALREDLTRDMHRVVTTEYGSTDEGQHWAALCAEDAEKVPTAFVSIMVGTGITGEAAVISRDGWPVREGVSFSAALRSARSVGIRGVRRNARDHKRAEVA